MKLKFALASALTLYASTGLSASISDVKVNGFFTAGGVFTDTDDATFLGADKDVTFEPDSVAALQFYMPIDDNVSVTTQIIAKGSDDFAPEFEWAFMTYGLTDDLDLRMGRLRIPFFMISDFLEVGFAYPWVRPPIDVYGQLAFSRYDGLNLLSRHQWGNLNAKIQGYYGTTSPEQDFFGDTGTLDISHLWGVNLTLSGDYLSFRIGHTEGHYDLEGIDQIDNLLAGLQGFGMTSLANRLGVTDKLGQFTGAGITWDKDEILLMAEYTQRSTDGLISDSEGWYVMGGYRFGKWMLHATYSQLETKEDYTDVEAALNGFDPSGATHPGTDFVRMMTNDEESGTIGMNYQARSKVIFKLEVQHIELGDNSSGTLQNMTAPLSAVNIVSFSVDSAF